MLERLSLADRSDVLRAAMAVVRAHSMADELEAVCLYDLAPKSKLERELVSLLGSVASDSFATCAPGETPTADSAAETRATATALHRLQAQLFTPSEARGAEDGSVSIFSAPGESRECVEIARGILDEAAKGVPFDRIAILLRSPFHYRTHLVEALRRAAIPAHSTRGTVRPEPGGRALLVLLRCAAEGLSAVRFAEYLSLGVAPASTALVDGTPASEADEAALLQQSQFPRRWEALLVDAAVVGGADRWRRRLRARARLAHQTSQADDPKSATKAGGAASAGGVCLAPDEQSRRCPRAPPGGSGCRC